MLHKINFNNILIINQDFDFDRLDISIDTDLLIAFDYQTTEKLKSKNITHLTVDELINKDDLDLIQELSYRFSEWYKKDEISDQITFHHVNLGELFFIELNALLIDFLKKFFTIQKLVNNYRFKKLIVSNKLYEIAKLFFENVEILYEEKNKISNFDSIEIPFTVFNKKFNLRLTFKKFEKIKNIFENFYHIINLRRHNFDDSILLIDFTTLRYKKLLLNTKNFPLNFVKFDTKIPAFWNIDSVKIIKNSNVILESFSKNSNKRCKNFSNKESFLIDTPEKFLLKNNSFFNNFFKFENKSFWPAFKMNFLNLYNLHWAESIEKILIIKKLFSKYNFKNVFLWNESDFNELIIINVSKSLGVPISLLQHGYYYLTDQRFTFENFRRVHSKNASVHLTWSSEEKNYSENHSISTPTIPIGCVFYDSLYDDSIPQEDFILLAADPPNYHTVHESTIEVERKYENIITQVCLLSKKFNKKLVIKLHPNKSLNEEKIVHNIDSQISIIHDGPILPLIKSAEFVIVTNFSSVILESIINKKPVFSISTYGHNGTPKIFSENYCKEIALENLDSTFKNFLDKKFKETAIYNGDRYIAKYYGNMKNSVDKFFDLLKN